MKGKLVPASQSVATSPQRLPKINRTALDDDNAGYNMRKKKNSRFEMPNASTTSVEQQLVVDYDNGE